MCGIAGYVQRATSPPADIESMLAAIAHRGPDGQGCWTAESAGWRITLGHRRLSIIDLAGGAQPMGNEDGSVQITYNGELYNIQSLRRDLESLGYRLRTRSDTEAIVL